MKRLRVSGYDVVIESGVLERIGSIAEGLELAHRYAVITDDQVGQLHGERVVKSFTHVRADMLTIPAGEREKSRHRWSDLTDRMLALGCGRDAAIIALGGGVVGDLAGFVAATYMRGIPVVQVPTTLLAMVDASIGGKTAVDTPTGKNLVGAFHRPAAVIIDPDALGTLDRAQLAGGFAEILKHGAIADAEYFSRAATLAPDAIARRDPTCLAELILRSVEIKSGVVERDEHERGERRALNFGHTIGHALEVLSGYSLLHGECVAIGMAVEAECGELIGVTEAGTSEGIRQALRAAGLPTHRPAHIDPGAVVEATATDKKAQRGMVRYALPASIGSMAAVEDGWTVPVPNEVVLSALA